MTDDDLYLQYFGGREQNSSSKLSQSDDESENLDIIRHQKSYFDHDAFINNAKTYKRFSILSNNIESIIAKFDTVQS